jgi:hypothetical protein
LRFLPLPSRVHGALPVLLTIGFLSGAASALLAGEGKIREYVDQATAVSITVPLDSLVFARTRTDLAVNARDYITLAPLEINRTGHRSYFWSGYVWSTIDRRGRQPVLAPDARLVLVADGRPIPLQADGKTLREQGVGQPPTPVPVRTATAVIFQARPEEIAYVARAEELRIETIQGDVSEPFLPWKQPREGLREFVARLQLEP